MPSSSGRPAGGFGRIAVGVVTFALVAPLALVAIPLAALLIASRPRRTREWLTAGIVGGFAVAWLLVPGELPDQLLRAATVIATAMFVPLTLRTATSFIHRALAAVGAAAVGLFALVPLVGASWGGIRWWVEHQTGRAARDLIGRMWLVGGGDSDLQPRLAQVAAGFEQIVGFVAEFYPALLALQVIAGLALATTIYARVADAPHGRALGTFPEFRFSEHLGWAAALPLVTLLIPKLVATKAAAVNLLVVTGTLYALRGAAVAAFGLGAIGAGGLVLWVLVGLAVFALLPVVIGGAIVLGVLDAGLDLRKRWRLSSDRSDL